MEALQAWDIGLITCGMGEYNGIEDYSSRRKNWEPNSLVFYSSTN